MKTIDVVAAIIEKDGEILAHIESVDWLPADVKVVYTPLIILESTNLQLNSL